MIREGEDRYTSWKKRNQSLSYVFREEVEKVLANSNLDSIFARVSGHPPILKKYLDW